MKCVLNTVAQKKQFYNCVINPQTEPFAFRFIMNTWSGIYRRQFLIDNNIRHNETLGASFQDNGFWFQTMIYATRIYVSDKQYYMNRRDNPNSSVYNKGKVYCINEEYRYIYNILLNDPMKYKQFIGEFCLKRYHNYMYHYNRIADERKLEYLQTVSGEFREAFRKKEVSSELFFSYEFDEFEWIAYDPEDYYQQHSEHGIKVSIIIPVYNAARYLRQCIESVLHQSLSQLEIICIDDGSTDDSLSILREYKKEDSRIKIIHQDNRGGGAARNRGIEFAKGEYILFLDADDYFESDTAEAAYNRCKETYSDICIFKVNRYHDVSCMTVSDQLSFVEEHIPEKNVFHADDLKDYIFATFQTWPWNKMFRRHFVEKNEIWFQEIRRTNDMFFTYTALVKADRLTVLRRELVNYRVGRRNNCQATNHEAPIDFFYALLKLRENLMTINVYKIYEKSFKNLVVRSCIYNLNSLGESQAHKSLYDYLKKKGFSEIDFGEWKDSDIFLENYNDYKECLCILNEAYEKFLFNKSRILLCRNREEAEKNNNLQRELDELKSIQRVMQEVSNLQEECKRYQIELINTRTSISCRIGLAITALPRKLKNFIKKNK